MTNHHKYIAAGSATSPVDGQHIKVRGRLRINVEIKVTNRKYYTPGTSERDFHLHEGVAETRKLHLKILENSYLLLTSEHNIGCTATT
jgi:hypothetical protein